MIEKIKSFLDECNNNEELTFFIEGLIECWMSGCNVMLWDIKNDENLFKIKEFFKKIYDGHENFYSIKKCESSFGRKEYEIKWYFTLEDIPV